VETSICGGYPPVGLKFLFFIFGFVSNLIGGFAVAA
jgi:hypothetical protein